MSSTFDTSQWITFFTKAGLPPNVAANYALIFSDNRIQLNMLMDLSKEYLYDMGIKIMGDVIAILRYAKEFHTQLAKERVIGISSSSKSAVAERMVGHYTRPVRASVKTLSPQRNDQDIAKPSTVISLKRTAEVVSFPKKVRRVPPEEEGAYKIKMPQGITEKTRKILKQQQKTAIGKKSVFARLGDSAVSSSTDTSKNSSVFERLGTSGRNCDDIPTSTVFGETDRKTIKGTPLQYQGVLKRTALVKTNTVSSNLQTKGNLLSRTVLKPGFRLQGIRKTINFNKINSILQSNDISKSGKIKASEGILGSSYPISKRLDAKRRLGVKMNYRGKSNKGTANVFSRLGKQK